MNLLKSIGAVIAGFAVNAILAVAVDKILEGNGIMKVDPFNDNPTWLIMVITLYRTIFGVIGCYVTARLAPSEPMKHAMILGGLGVVLTTIGLIVMWDVPPHWYPISLIILTLPAAWVGGKVATKK